MAAVHGRGVAVEFFDRQGQPIDLATWTRLIHDAYQRVLRTEIDGDALVVSTVWLGVEVDPAHKHSHRPIIFETIVFRDGVGGDCWRYATEAESVAGHHAAVAAVRVAHARNKIRIV